MNDCKGIIGKIFGHNYVNYVLEKSLPSLTCEFKNISSSKLIKMIEESRQVKYAIICKRCGIAKGQENA